MSKIASCITAAFFITIAANASAQVADFKPVTEATLANPDPADWLMISRTFDEQRFSPLNQINKVNVGQLRMVWSRGLPRRHPGIDANRLSRRYVPICSRRQHPGCRCHQR